MAFQFCGADATRFTPVLPECSPSRRRSIQQIVLPDSRWSLSEMSLDFGEFGAQEIESFIRALFGLLIMRGTAVSGGSNTPPRRETEDQVNDVGCGKYLGSDIHHNAPLFQQILGNILAVFMLLRPFLQRNRTPIILF